MNYGREYSRSSASLLLRDVQREVPGSMTPPPDPGSLGITIPPVWNILGKFRRRSCCFLTHRNTGFGKSPVTSDVHDRSTGQPPVNVRAPTLKHFAPRPPTPLVGVSRTPNMSTTAANYILETSTPAQSAGSTVTFPSPTSESPPQSASLLYTGTSTTSSWLSSIPDAVNNMFGRLRSVSSQIGSNIREV